MGQIDRALPHSPTHERWILGAILSAPGEHAAVYDLLKPENFYLDPHRKIFRTIQALRERRQVPDMLSVHDALLADGGLESIGGIGYLAGLADGIPRVASSGAVGRSRPGVREAPGDYCHGGCDSGGSLSGRGTSGRTPRQLNRSPVHDGPRT